MGVHKHHVEFKGSKANPSLSREHSAFKADALANGANKQLNSTDRGLEHKLLE